MLYTVLMKSVASKRSLRFPRRMNISEVDLSFGKHNEQLREFILPWGPVQECMRYEKRELRGGCWNVF